MAKDSYGVADELVAMLARQGKKIASVESCTGGLISKLITDIPGSSEVFELGITTYSNEMKTRMVGVPKEILNQYGAVSPQTAEAMAVGIRALSGADIGVSTTGIAGPGGGTPDKPVGLVYTALATAEGVRVTRLLMDEPGADRDLIRRKTAETVLNHVITHLKASDE